VGEKEQNANNVSARKRSVGDQGSMELEDFVKMVEMENKLYK